MLVNMLFIQCHY